MKKLLNFYFFFISFINKMIAKMYLNFLPNFSQMLDEKETNLIDLLNFFFLSLEIVIKVNLLNFFY